MPPKGSKKRKVQVPLAAYPQIVSGSHAAYKGRTISVPGLWWEDKPFSPLDPALVMYKCIVQEHDPSHKFGNKPTCHAMGLREVDPLTPAERTAAPSLADPQQYKTIHWMGIKLFEQLHNRAHSAWDTKTLADKVEEPAAAAAAAVVVLDNPHLSTKKAKTGRDYSMYPYIHFKHEEYTSLTATYDNGAFKIGIRFICMCELPTGLPCNFTADILDRLAPGKSGGTGKLTDHLKIHHVKLHLLHLKDKGMTAADDGRYGSYLNAEGGVVEKYKKTDVAYYEQNFAFMKMVQKQHLSFQFGEAKSVKFFARTLDPKSSLWYAETLLKRQAIHRQLGDSKRHQKLIELKERLGERFLCLMLDMWKNSGTLDHYAALNYSWLERTFKDFSLNEADQHMVPYLEIKTGLLDFVEFQEKSHTGANIESWLEKALRANRVGYENTLLIIPDGAAPNITAMEIVKLKDMLIQSAVCDVHDLQRCILSALGLGKKTRKNDYMADLLKKVQRIGAKLRNTGKLAAQIKEVQDKHNAEDEKTKSKQAKSISRNGATRWNGHYKAVTEINFIIVFVNPTLETLGTLTFVRSEVDADWDGDGDDDAVETVDCGTLQLGPQETRVLRETEAVLKQLMLATQKMQGENSINADETWPLVFNLHKFMGNPATLILVPRVIEWPLQDTVTCDVRRRDQLHDSVQLLMKGVTEELQERFIKEGPLDVELVCMKLNPSRNSHPSLNDTHLQKMDAEYRYQFSLMQTSMGVAPALVEAAAAEVGAADSEVMEIEQTGGFLDFMDEGLSGLSAGPAVQPASVENEMEAYAKLTREQLNEYGAVPIEVTKTDGTKAEGKVFNVRVFWARPEVEKMLPVHTRMVEKFYALLRSEATTERTFSDSGLTASDRRKNMKPEHLSNATMCADNERSFPVSTAELKAAVE